MDVTQIADRKNEIRAATPTAYAKQRMAEQATALSLAGDLAAHCEIANEALCKLTVVLYEPASDGLAANVDYKTGRLLIPAPWGSSGWRKWGLRDWQATILRMILLTRQDHFVPRKTLPPLYTYNRNTRQWFLEIGDYQDLNAAKRWLERGQIRPTEWREAQSHYRQRRINLQSRHRQRRVNLQST